MLLKRLNNEKFETELPMPHFDTVEPALPIKDLSKACIAIVGTILFAPTDFEIVVIVAM